MGLHDHYSVHDWDGLCAYLLKCIPPPWLLTRIFQLIAGSRQIFAFSRDHGLPFSGLLYNMNPRTKTPVHAVCFVALFALLLGLISFAGSVAITAVFTMSVVCQYIGFTIPIVARWVGGTKFVPGPFSLGKLVSGALAEDPVFARLDETLCDVPDFPYALADFFCVRAFPYRPLPPPT